ncbi:peptide-methionine (S)-S-oxide reductase MsrA [Hyphomonas sp. GM-8P]|jgi:peptide-methionine (S)-S-oxide reductase|uniref:peptide-methionine (S)-S-oxide reductase MsrA n=1 Tax=Hyphomonas sp. GM-8P TaxID=1280945 RepID=UPI0018EF8C8E|nr:peptide-methionine (S)-S-oxide reductase MsrA [Hyphomonas sp. GM-8P]
MRTRSPQSVALVAGLAAMALGFFSSAGAQDQVSSPDAKRLSTAVFAGGCFWCVEADFDKVDGVVSTVSGYTGGTVVNPTYKQVSHEKTGHYEAVKVTYDPDKVSYDALVDYYFHHIDPTDATGQFCDKGDSYRSAVFVANGDQREVVEAEIDMINASGVLGTPVVTQILDASTFWPAEDYHQDYYKKNPLKYRYYRTACGRDARVKNVWAGASSGH